jgi:hypothetical protein
MLNPFIVLRYGTDENKEFTQRVTNADVDVDVNDVRAAMSDIISFDPFDTGKGKLDNAISAHLTYYNERPLNVHI